MNRSKRLYILLGVLVLLCAATGLLLRSEQKKEAIKESGETVLAIEPDTVQSFSVKNEKGDLAFHRDEDGTWKYDADDAFPVDQDQIETMLSRFAAFGAAFVIEDVEDYAQYGLTKPVCTITLTTDGTETGLSAAPSGGSGNGDSHSYEIKLGDFSKMDDERYVSVGDGRAYLAAIDPYDAFDISLPDVIQNDRTPAFDEVSEIRFAGAEAYSISYEEDNTADSYCADDVYFTEQDGKKQPLDTELVDDYLHMLSNLDLSNYVSYKATEEELTDYGLDDPELTISVDYQDEDDKAKSGSSKSGSGSGGSGDSTSADAGSGTFVLSVSRDPKERTKADEEAAKTAAEQAGKRTSEIAAESENENASAEASGSMGAGGDGSGSAADSESGTDESVTAYVRVGNSPIIYEIEGSAYRALMKASYDELRHKALFTADLSDVAGMTVTLDGEHYELTRKGGSDESSWSYQEEDFDDGDLDTAIKALAASDFTEDKPIGKEEVSLTLHLDSEEHPELRITLYRENGSTCLAEVNGEPTALIPREQAVSLIEAVNAIVLK